MLGLTHRSKRSWRTTLLVLAIASFVGTESATAQTCDHATVFAMCTHALQVQTTAEAQEHVVTMSNADASGFRLGAAPHRVAQCLQTLSSRWPSYEIAQLIDEIEPNAIGWLQRVASLEMLPAAMFGSCTPRTQYGELRLWKCSHVTPLRPCENVAAPSHCVERSETLPVWAMRRADGAGAPIVFADRSFVRSPTFRVEHLGDLWLVRWRIETFYMHREVVDSVAIFDAAGNRVLAATLREQSWGEGAHPSLLAEPRVRIRLLPTERVQVRVNRTEVVLQATPTGLQAVSQSSPMPWSRS